MEEPLTLSRRYFLIAGGAAGAGLVLGVSSCAPADPAPGDINMWLHIAPDGLATLRVNATELGQGAQTGLAQIVCDELDGDWSRMRVEMAPVTDAYLVKDGQYFTGGSTSISTQFDRFAIVGAAARAMLIAAAAKKWSVDPGACHAANGVVFGPKGKRLGFGALAGDAAQLEVPASPRRKSPRERTLIGKAVPRLDIPDKVDGRAVYGFDMKRSGLLTATILQCPFFGGTLASVDEAPARAVKGVRSVVRLEDAVAVVATNFWSALKGLRALSPHWTKPAGAIVSDEAMFAALRKEIGANDSTLVAWPHGNAKAMAARVDAALKTAKSKFEAEYAVPLVAHAPMEPMNATAVASRKSCELWAPMQNQSGMRNALSEALGLPRSAIVLHTTDAGGGFGRRLQTDYGVQAARIAKAVSAPVKLVWTREEDFAHDFYRPASVGRIRAALANDLSFEALDFTGATTNDTAIGGFLRNYPCPAGVVRQKRVAFPLPVGAWRSVDSSITVFFIESFVDEVAHAHGIDPFAYRRQLLKDAPRELRTLEAAAAMADWGHAPTGRAQGIAFFSSASWGTSVAEIVELSVDAANRVTLHKVFCAIDPGVAVNPNQIESQAMGAVAFGLSAALGEAVTVKDGAAEQRNFDTYPILGLAAAPEIHVRILETEGAPPGGVGEPAVPPAAPALVNAVFAATGRRVRTLPLSRSGFSF